MIEHNWHATPGRTVHRHWGELQKHGGQNCSTVAHRIRNGRRAGHFWNILGEDFVRSQTASKLEQGAVGAWAAGPSPHSLHFLPNSSSSVPAIKQTCRVAQQRRPARAAQPMRPAQRARCRPAARRLARCFRSREVPAWRRAVPLAAAAAQPEAQRAPAPRRPVVQAAAQCQRAAAVARGCR
jgi:hypothetical protein